jgi:hypothetical protein
MKPFFSGLREKIKSLFAGSAKVSVPEPGSQALMIRPQKEFGSVATVYIPYLRDYIDPVLLEQLSSPSLDEFKKAIMVVMERIGRSHYIIAIILYTKMDAIRSAKKNGLKDVLTSIKDFLDSLPEKYRISRQTLYNAIRAGEILYHHGSYLEGENSKGPFRISGKGLDFPILCRNYAKLPILYNVWKRDDFSFTDAILRHLENDTVLVFGDFIKGLLTPPNKTAVKHSKKEKPAIPALSKEQRAIYHLVSKGMKIVFIENDDELERFILKGLKEYYIERENHYKSQKDTLFDIDSISKMGILPTDLCAYSWILGDLIFNHKPEEIRLILAKECQTIQQLRLAQAYVVFRIYNDPDIRDTYMQSGEALCPSDFAMKYLGVSKSECKLLHRIAENLRYLPLLVQEGIDPFANGCLDKLANLEQAFAKSGQTLETLTVFKAVDVRTFRQYAQKGKLVVPSVSEFSPKMAVYKKALEPLTRYESYCNRGIKVKYIPLYSISDEAVVKTLKAQYQAEKDLKIKEMASPSIKLLPDYSDGFSDEQGNKTSSNS